MSDPIDDIISEARDEPGFPDHRAIARVWQRNRADLDVASFLSLMATGLVALQIEGSPVDYPVTFDPDVFDPDIDVLTLRGAISGEDAETLAFLGLMAITAEQAMAENWPARPSSRPH